MLEEFKDIPNYENLYQISNLGRVKSLPKSDGNGKRTLILKLETVVKEHTSYQRVTLSKNGKVQRYQVHRLVAKAFIPNTDNKPLINHIDNNGLNNKVTNLEWCTQAENMQHSAKQGRQDSTRRLGGLVAGRIKRNKAFKKYESFVNTVFGNLIVDSYYFDNITGKIKFKCTCTCGNTTTKNLTKLTSGAQKCEQCTYKQRGETRKSKMKI